MEVGPSVRWDPPFYWTGEGAKYSRAYLGIEEVEGGLGDFLFFFLLKVEGK